MSELAAVRERPILFSGPMVRAILDGKKTQTRRVVQARRFDRVDVSEATGRDGWAMVSPRDNWTPEQIAREFPNRHGQPGDRLWVRETWQICRPALTSGINAGAGFVPSYVKSEDVPWFAANYEDHKFSYPATDDYGEDPPRWRPSIFMPRFASRLTLEITDVRVERLQGISTADAWAEGIRPEDVASHAGDGTADLCDPETAVLDDYRMLWDSLNAPRGYSWIANPWVWVITFRRLDP